MPIQPTYPGVYIQEIPSGTHTIAGVATSITGFVGYLRRGPLNTPVQCLNFGDFQRAFGGVDAASATSFQVSQFFLSGGSEAWVSRLYASAATAQPVQPAAAVPCGPLGGKPDGSALAVSSLNPGSWGQNVFVTVDYLSTATGTFDLTATLYNFSSAGASVVQVQTLQGVTLDATQPNYLVEVLGSPAPSYAGLIAIADPHPQPVAGQPYTPPAGLPFASGTLMSFQDLGTTTTGVTLTVTVQAPAPPGGKAPQASTVQVPVGNIGVLSDALGAIQAALAVTGAQLNLPTLASSVVRASLSPFPVTPPATPTPLIQAMATDPMLAGYVVTIAAAPKCGLAQVSAGPQAVQLVAPAPPTGTTPGPPDGLPPTGFDVAGNSTNRTGIYALEAMSLVNILCVPDMPMMTAGDYLIAGTSTLNYALRRRAFAIIDIPSTVTTPQAAVAWMTSVPGNFGPGIISAASYFPQVSVPTPFATQPMTIGACGTMAGLYAATDLARGVWKAPAGITAALAGVQQLPYVMTDQENGLINPLGMNGLRTFPIYDNIAWGARTLAAANVADDDWKYVPVRRLALYIEQSLLQGLQWAVFEPNDETLWAQIRLTANSFLQPLFQQGAFVGASPTQAYQVVCDGSTTTPQDMDSGVVNVLVMFAPVRPAEFVVISIQQMAGQSAS